MRLAIMSLVSGVTASKSILRRPQGPLEKLTAISAGKSFWPRTVPRYRLRLPMEQVPAPGLAMVPGAAGSGTGRMPISPPTGVAMGVRVERPEGVRPVAVGKRASDSLPGAGKGAPEAVGKGRLELELGRGKGATGLEPGSEGGAGAGAAWVSCRWQA